MDLVSKKRILRGYCRFARFRFYNSSRDSFFLLFWMMNTYPNTPCMEYLLTVTDRIIEKKRLR